MSHNKHSMLTRSKSRKLDRDNDNNLKNYRYDYQEEVEEPREEPDVLKSHNFDYQFILSSLDNLRTLLCTIHYHIDECIDIFLKSNLTRYWKREDFNELFEKIRKGAVKASYVESTTINNDANRKIFKNSLNIIWDILTNSKYQIAFHVSTIDIIICLSTLCSGTRLEKARRVFNLLDRESTGYITRFQFQHNLNVVLKMVLSFESRLFNNLAYDPEEMSEITTKEIFTQLGRNQITFREMYNWYDTDYEYIKTTKNISGELNKLFVQAKSLKLTNVSAIYMMKRNIKLGRFSYQYYIDKLESRIKDHQVMHQKNNPKPRYNLRSGPK